MRGVAAFVLSLSFTLVGGLALGPALSAAADAPDLDGRWKLIALPYGDDEFLIFDVKATDGKLAGTVTSAQPILGSPKSAEVTVEGDRVELTFPMPGEPLRFRGTLSRDGKALGMVRFRGANHPARIEKTEAKAVAKLQPSPAQKKLGQARATTDAKERIAKTLDLIRENPGHPVNAMAYGQILASAEDAGLGPEEVRGHTQAWADEAKAYGPEWSADVQSRALKALQGKKAYAELATELALAADKGSTDAVSLDVRGQILNMLASSARLAGKEDIAAEAEGRLKAIDEKLDAEYHEKVPPFKPEAYAGRGPGEGERIVLMEIFTGAECPPCVAADVAFDALLKTYKPTEFIGLQYHLHIPGPDPLTNPDSMARGEYYGKDVRGTPSTFFNGKTDAGGGGSMAGAEGKHKEYRGVIEPSLGGEKRADIEVKASRAGDAVKIVARATAKPDDGEEAKDAKPKLRLVLVEESVRYPGGNKLRFHHNVVRALPGGVEGKALEAGKGEIDITLNLAELRKGQETYLEQFPSGPRGRSFPHPLPPIDLDDLAVVAMVQDDADHSVWHAVQVPVEGGKP